MVLFVLLIVAATGAFDGIGAGAFPGLLTVGVVLACGGGVSAAASAFGAGGEVNSSIMPLGVTAAGFAVLAAVFLRRLRAGGVDRPADVLLQAVRTWAVFAAGLFVTALVARVSPDTSSGDGPLAGAVTFTVSGGVVSTVFWGSVGLALTLAVAVAWFRPEALPGRCRRWRDASAGAAAGVRTSLLVFLLAGWLAAGIAAIAVAAETSEPAAGVAAFLGVLLFGPNVVLAAFALAVGTPIDSNLATSLFGVGQSGSLDLLSLTELEPWFWLLPVLAAVALLTGGVVAARRAPGPVDARRTCWRFAVATAVAFAVVASVTAASTDGSFLGTDSTLTFGVNGPVAVLLGGLWGLLAGWLGAVVAPSLPSPAGHAPAAAAGYGGPPDLVGALEELARRYAAGAISADEYRRAKARLLGHDGRG